MTDFQARVDALVAERNAEERCRHPSITVQAPTRRLRERVLTCDHCPATWAVAKPREFPFRAERVVTSPTKPKPRRRHAPKKSNRGGPRPGSGRPRKSPAV